MDWSALNATTNHILHGTYYKEFQTLDMENKKRYWKGVEELTNDLDFVKNADREFPEYLPVNSNKETSEDVGASSNRRDFLKLMGFGIGAATLAACQTPVRKAIPYVVKPTEVDPGIPNYYASTFQMGGDYAAVLVKTREGRPIKIEGNKLSPINMGGVNAQIDASVLSLYDKGRFQGPKANGQDISWTDLDAEVTTKLNEVAAAGGNIRVVTNTVLSPSTKAAVGEFVAKYPTTQHVQYDAVSFSGMHKANERSFGAQFIPSYDFSKADVIVSFAADFLGTWLSPVEFTKQYAKTRKLNADKQNMSRHYQFESNLSLTGANADYREPVKPSQQGLLVANLYNLLARQAGVGSVSVPAMDNRTLAQAAQDLWAARGKALVVSGSNDADVQVMVNAINQLLGSYGKTIDNNTPVMYRQGSDEAMGQFINDLKGGNVGAVIFYGANPVYDHPMGKVIAENLGKASLTVSTSIAPDETTEKVAYIAPDHHYLESWNDANPKAGMYSLGQPAISPIFNTRQAQESFLTWAGNTTNMYDYVRSYWRSNLFSTTDALDFDRWFDQMLHDGVFQMSAPAANLSYSDATGAAAAGIGRNYKASNEGLELALYQKVGIGTGAQANNPWLQEMPDPISKATWDNYVSISMKMAEELGITLSEGKSQTVTLTVGSTSMEVPALVQPGQAPGTIGLAIGYGRTKAGKVAEGVGVDAYPLVAMLNGTTTMDLTANVSVAATGNSYQLAQTQTHQTYMGRTNVVQETILKEYKKDNAAGYEGMTIHTSEGIKEPYAITLWGHHEYKNHHWGMAIDMNSCTGCGACTVACQTENNIPVVGKQEVVNRREMHWIRIDRYYSSDAYDPVKDLTEPISGFNKSRQAAMEDPSANPQVTFQPMMCQQCNNAPCETVCPVAATTHSTEGLNQMTYNRCIGTRYCANNCPYKVRRFNWFKYHDNKQFADTNTPANDDLGKMVLNPDVTVRSRGVMEKCTFCVQRIQLGKLEAKKEGRRPQDGEVVSACASACPADAIIFGDMKDPESRIAKALGITNTDDPKVKKHTTEPRAYHVLEELRVHPNVFYLRKVRNIEAAAETTEA